MSFARRYRQRSEHETRISKCFDGHVYFDGQGPVFEKPLGVLLFSNRTGSNLLAEHLRQTRAFVGFHEQLNYTTVERIQQRENLSTFPQYIQQSVSNALSPNPAAIFGVKASAEQLMMLFRFGILDMFPSVKIINIEREDLLSQAASMLIAVQTEQWTSAQNKKADATYDHELMLNIFEGQQAEIGFRRGVLSLLPFDRTTVTYEELCNNPYDTVEKCCSLFGVSLPDGLEFRPSIGKQGTSLNEAFCRQFTQILNAQSTISVAPPLRERLRRKMRKFWRR